MVQQKKTSHLQSLKPVYQSKQGITRKEKINIEKELRQCYEVEQKLAEFNNQSTTLLYDHQNQTTDKTRSVNIHDDQNHEGQAKENSIIKILPSWYQHHQLLCSQTLEKVFYDPCEPTTYTVIKNIKGKPQEDYCTN